jgi:deoxyribonuclease-4
MAKYPIIGIHAFRDGGLVGAVLRAEALRCDCLQIFSRNPRGWSAPPLDRNQVRQFRNLRERAGLWPLAVHSIYLINLAATDRLVLDSSRRAFRQEIERCIELDADYLVVHPGNPKGGDLQRAIATLAESIRAAVRGLKLGRLSILIENTAGQGSAIGHRFEQVAEIISELDGIPVGVCLDTAHAFAAGYDISTEAGFKATLRDIESSFGLERIKLIHSNDSKAPMGSRLDRHQHIGLGYIGAEGFGRLLRSLKFRRIPFILETPVDPERDDRWNLARMRELSRL